MDKPVIEAQSGPAPTDLVVEDIVVGDGAEAQPGAVVEVHYVGAEYETNQEFKLIIPPEKAYGPAGGAHPLSGRTLVFIIDLIRAD